MSIGQYADPEHLYQLEEPFGKNENNPEGINDGVLKSGSLVTAFVNTYYTNTGITVSHRDFLKDKNIKIRHEYILWCQGRIGWRQEDVSG